MANFRNRLSKIIREYGEVASYLPNTLRLFWDATRALTIGWLTLLIFQGLFPLLNLYFTKLFVDLLFLALHSTLDQQILIKGAGLLLLMLGLMVSSEISTRLMNWVQQAQSLILTDHINGVIHQHSIRLDMSIFDSPDYYDRLWRAQFESGTKMLELQAGVGSVLQNTITFLAVIIILAHYSLWIPVVLFVGALPALAVVLKFGLIERRWRIEATAEERKCWYYDLLLKNPHVAPEVKFFGLGNHFAGKYQAVRKWLRVKRLDIVKRENSAQFWARIFALIMTASILGWTAWKAFAKIISPGDLALIYQAISRGQILMGTMLSNLGQLYNNILFIKFFFEFLKVKPNIQSPNNPVAPPAIISEGIRLSGVSFSYPGTQNRVFEHFNLFIPAGKTVAIVGDNGAGKSTLLKLLCRLYDPTAGQVQLDGVDIRHFNLQDYHRKLSMIFQSPVEYYASAKDNICYGDIETHFEFTHLKKAAHNSGADEFIEQLPHKYDTLLGKYFRGGTELSVGQSQRLALARAYYRRASVILLDEPTSAMDSWAENTWYKRFKELSLGKTVVIVTHRFTTAMKADHIFVMKKGILIEEGSHNQLIEINGYYAKSWLEQIKHTKA